jgi:dTMP kinase
MVGYEKRPRVISLEGGEGSGKTTVLLHLEQYFNSKGLDVLFTREPGGVRIAEAIREVILNVSHTEMDARTEALLYASARRQHLTEKVLPAVAAGKWVIFDRFVDSSMVYQGFVRGIGIQEVYELNRFATEDFLPDLTLYLDVTPEVGLKRVMETEGREVNRLDLEGIEFHRKVQEGYHILMKQFPERLIRIDADQTLEEVLDAVTNVIDRFMEGIEHED